MPVASLISRVLEKPTIKIAMLVGQQIVRMSQHECHATMTFQVIELARPCLHIAFASSNKQCVVLWQGIRQFHKTPCHKWPDAAHAAWHGLIRIDIKAGAVVFNIQRLQPVQIAMHHWRAKADGPVPLERRDDATIFILSTLITLTPGSLSIDVASDRSVLYIHAMYMEDADAFRYKIKHGFERRLLGILE